MVDPTGDNCLVFPRLLAYITDNPEGKKVGEIVPCRFQLSRKKCLVFCTWTVTCPQIAHSAKDILCSYLHAQSCPRNAVG
jgi:hypothetical protein